MSKILSNNELFEENENTITIKENVFNKYDIILVFNKENKTYSLYRIIEIKTSLICVEILLTTDDRKDLFSPSGTSFF